MRLCFDLYDLDGSGKISRSEMKSVVTYVQSNKNVNVFKNILSLGFRSMASADAMTSTAKFDVEALVDGFFADIDEDDDNELDFNEFCTVYNSFKQQTLDSTAQGNTPTTYELL